MRWPMMHVRMSVPRAAWLIFVAVLLTDQSASAEPYKPDPGPFQVQAFLLDPHDEARDRDVPLRVYRPVDADGPRPVVLVSHGLGGTRDGLSYLGRHWASHGYICVHMQHQGSDAAVWRDVSARDRIKAMRRAALDPDNATSRAQDTIFVLDELTRLSTDEASELHGSLDLDKAGIAGHSFGAWTCMAAGGMTTGGLRAVQHSDERIRCMIPLSPPVIKNEQRYERTYKTLNIPALFMTGTLDTSPITSTTAEQRLIPYRTMPGVSDKGAAKYLINFDGADHMTFSGETGINKRLRKADPETDPVFHGLILQSTTAFLDAYLLGDEPAKKWLDLGAFEAVVGERGVVELDARRADAIDEDAN